MRVSHVLRAGSVIALAGLVACGDQQPTAPPSAQRFEAQGDFKRSSGSDEVGKVSAALGRINRRLAATGSNLRVFKAEARYAAKGANEATSTLIFANDRVRGLIAEWVEGDERRDGRRGVTYAFDPVLQTSAFGLSNLPAIETNGGTGLRLSTQAELETYLEEGMQAWRSRKCSDSPIERVSVAAGTDPDQLDEFFLLEQGPSANYVQPADIVQAGWQPPLFFNNYTPDGATFILGVTFTFIFVDDQETEEEDDDVPTDVDGNGKLDAALREIYYNPSFIWTNQGTSGFIDFFSILTHETGHALDLAHFGKVFITKKDASDGIDITDVKYAPEALMNAVYVDGRGNILGTDNSSFCQIWASK